MPIDYTQYPPDWKLRSKFVRFVRAKGRCEDCGAVHGQPHPVTGSKVVLTTSHQWHDLDKSSLLDLRARCQKCHLAYDQDHHRRQRAANRMTAGGQLLLDLAPPAPAPPRAVFSFDRRYRYHLWREWETGEGSITFIGLNPSTGDGQQDDPTIRRLIGFAKAWGYRRLDLVNLFALVSPDPAALASDPDPIGRRNDQFLRRVAGDGAVVFMWGANRFARDRAAEVAQRFSAARCFGLTKDGSPRHPLYLAKETELIEFPQASNLRGQNPNDLD